MPKGSISFFFEDIEFKIYKKKIISLLETTLRYEKKKLKSINYIFCSDKFLHQINLKFLNHDTLTDVITFKYGDDNYIDGEIYISLDRVKENGKIFNEEIYDELLRVIIHGALHLCGYNDVGEEEKKIMRQKEDFYLKMK
ncbi:MAG: rRNA maturation RNase YbeY [Cytophagales bacterium]|jgi:rRNA maturation RNase YbeY|nr:rRNA maturation RNase YbeY [Cytophagales bacterium]